MGLALGAAPDAARAAIAKREPAFVLVTAFENTSESRAFYWVGEALADGLAREIERGGGRVIERRDRMAIREEMGVPALSALTLASQIRAADHLGADMLLSGTFGADGDTLGVLVRTVDLRTGRTGSWIRVSGSVKNVVQLQADLYRAVVSILPAPDRKAQADPPIPEDGVPQAAYEALIKSYLEDAADKRERFLKRALEVAPNYLRAKIELAQLYRAGGQFDKATQILTNMATTDRPLAASGETLLAAIALDQGHGIEAEAAIRRSIALGDSVDARLLLGQLALARGDRAGARAELERARAIDPADPGLAEFETTLAQ